MKKYRMLAFIGLTLTLAGPASLAANEKKAATASTAFTLKACEMLPIEPAYAYHDRISSGPVHGPCRNADAQPTEGEMAIPAEGWTIVIAAGADPLIHHAANDLGEYLEASMQVAATIKPRDSLKDWRNQKRAIIAGTPDQLPGAGSDLKGPKDYRIAVEPERIVVCGFDPRGVMFGLYNLEDRMSLPEAPFLPDDLDRRRSW